MEVKEKTNLLTLRCSIPTKFTRGLLKTRARRECTGPTHTSFRYSSTDIHLKKRIRHQIKKNKKSSFRELS